MSRAAGAAGWSGDQDPSSGTPPTAVHARPAPSLPDLVFTGPVAARHAAGRSRRRNDAVSAPLPTRVVAFERDGVADERFDPAGVDAQTAVGIGDVAGRLDGDSGPGATRAGDLWAKAIAASVAADIDPTRPRSRSRTGPTAAPEPTSAAAPRATERLRVAGPGPRRRPSILLGGVPEPGVPGLVLPAPWAAAESQPTGPRRAPDGVEVPDWVREQAHRIWAVARATPQNLGGVPDTGAGLLLPEPVEDLAPIHHRALLRLVLPGSEFTDVAGRHGVFDPSPRRITAHLVVPPTHAAPRPAPTSRTARPARPIRTRPAPAPLRPAFRRSTWWQATAGGLALAVGVPAAAMIAPTALGGGTSWTIVVGHSMEPTLDPGDLVFTRAQDSYGAGDVVVYTIPEGTAGAGVMIIHRIVGGNAEEGYITRGDNRDRNDPWRPTPDLITGKHWRTIDGGGNVVVWLRSPLAIAGLLGVTAFVGTLELARKQEEEEREALTALDPPAGSD